MDPTSIENKQFGCNQAETRTDLINHPSSAHDTVEECSDGVAMAQVTTNLNVHVLCCCCHREINRYRKLLIFDPKPLPEEKRTNRRHPYPERDMYFVRFSFDFWHEKKRGWIRFHDKDFIGRHECDECRSVVRNVLRENSDFLPLL